VMSLLKNGEIDAARLADLTRRFHEETKPDETKPDETKTEETKKS
jgi:hypothetical protein